MLHSKPRLLCAPAGRAIFTKGVRYIWPSQPDYHCLSLRNRLALAALFRGWILLRCGRHLSRPHTSRRSNADVFQSRPHRYSISAR